MTSSRLLRRLRTSVLLASFTAVTVGALQAQEDRAALDSFMKQMREFDAAAEALSIKTQKMPGGGIVMVRTVAARVRMISTVGLPADLQVAFREYVDAAQALVAVFKEWPEKPEDTADYVRRKLAENPEFLREGQTKNAPVMAAMGKAIANLDEVGRKHGLEGLAALAQ